ncbi:MAG: hypothetical protein IRZ13_12970 [Acetobacteraceae bacterium]|nr:hypothetical protein [Acetobacteraceae bacterium]
MPTDTAAAPSPPSGRRRYHRRGFAPVLPVVLLAASLLGLAGCDGEGLVAGGEYSGVPDTPIGVGRSELNPYGYIRNDGTIVLDRETGDYRGFPRR